MMGSALGGVESRLCLWVSGSPLGARPPRAGGVCPVAPSRGPECKPRFRTHHDTMSQSVTEMLGGVAEREYQFAPIMLGRNGPLEDDMA